LSRHRLQLMAELRQQRPSGFDPGGRFPRSKSIGAYARTAVTIMSCAALVLFAPMIARWWRLGNGGTAYGTWTRWQHSAYLAALPAFHQADQPELP
jgi:hypothetical protein